MFNKRSVLFLLLILVVYSPLIGNKTYSPDSHIILPPLLEASPLDYVKMVLNFETVDFQPVRDLTFFLDVAVFRLTGVSTFSFSNILFWMLSCFLLFRLTKIID